MSDIKTLKDCNSRKLLEKNCTSIPFTFRNYQKMSNASLNSSCDSISDDSIGALNIVPSTFYSNSTGEYLSPLQRMQLKRNLPSSGSDENVSPIPNLHQEEPKQVKLAKKGRMSREVKKRAFKPRSSNSNGGKKSKFSKGAEATASKRESLKEVEREDNGEKYKNNKFFKHRPMGHLKERISWKIFASSGLKPFGADKKNQFKAISSSDKLLEPIENKTLSSPDVYDCLPDDNAENSMVEIQSGTKLNRTSNVAKKWIVNSFSDTLSSNISVADGDQNKDGSIPRCKPLPVCGSQNSNSKVCCGVKQQSTHDKIPVENTLHSLNIKTRSAKRKQSQFKQSPTDAAKKSETKMHKTQHNSKSIQGESSGASGSKNLDANISVCIEEQSSYDESITKYSAASITGVRRSEKRQKPASNMISVNRISQNLGTEVCKAKRKPSLTNGSKKLATEVAKNRERQKSQNRSSAISGSDSVDTDISVSGTEEKSCHKSIVNYFHISETELCCSKKRRKLSCTKPSVIHSAQTPKTKILKKMRQPLLYDSAIISNLQNLQSASRAPQQSELIQDIFKDLEETFNEIEPTVPIVQNSESTDLTLNVSLFEKEKVIEGRIEKDEFLDGTIDRVEFLEDTLGGDGFLESTIGREDLHEEKALYPIFCAQEKNESSVTKSSKKKLKMSISTKTAVPEENTEFIIDAGQKVIGATECPTCGMVFHVGSEQDEKLHAKNHEMFILNLKFPGWKREHVVGEYYDGKIIMIKKEDRNFMLKKVEDVLKIVDRDLGFPNLGFPRRPNAIFLLFIFDKTVVGCLVAESITSARRVELDAPANVSSCFPQDNKEKSERWCTSAKLVKAICGINRIWVSREYRRKKIATRLLNCLRLNFLYGYTMSKNEIAFSDPSINGRDFASVYMGTSNFLVYK